MSKRANISLEELRKIIEGTHLTTNELSEKLEVSAKAIRRWVATGTISTSSFIKLKRLANDIKKRGVAVYTQNDLGYLVGEIEKLGWKVTLSKVD